MQKEPLSIALEKWSDWDSVCFDLGVSFGMWRPDEWFKLKHLFWTNNPVGNGLYKCVEGMVEAGVLEKNDEDQYRWKQTGQ